MFRVGCKLLISIASLESVMAPGSRYIPQHELIELAIVRKVIAGWDSLVLMGIPSEYVNALKSTEIGFQSDS